MAHLCWFTRRDMKFETRVDEQPGGLFIKLDELGESHRLLGTKNHNVDPQRARRQCWKRDIFHIDCSIVIEFFARIFERTWCAYGPDGTYLNKLREICNFSPVDFMIMKLGSDCHPPVASKTNESYIHLPTRAE